MADRKRNNNKNSGVLKLFGFGARRGKSAEQEQQYIDEPEEEEELVYSSYEDDESEYAAADAADEPVDDYEDEEPEEEVDFDFDRFFGAFKPAGTPHDYVDEADEPEEEYAPAEESAAEDEADSRRISYIDDSEDDEVDLSSLRSFMHSFKDDPEISDSVRPDEKPAMQSAPQDDPYEIEINYEEDEKMDFSHLGSYIDDTTAARREAAAAKEQESEIDFDSLGIRFDKPKAKDMRISFDEDDDDEPVYSAPAQTAAADMPDETADESVAAAAEPEAEAVPAEPEKDEDESFDLEELMAFLNDDEEETEAAAEPEAVNDSEDEAETESEVEEAETEIAAAEPTVVIAAEEAFPADEEAVEEAFSAAEEAAAEEAPAADEEQEPEFSFDDIFAEVKGYDDFFEEAEEESAPAVEEADDEEADEISVSGYYSAEPEEEKPAAQESYEEPEQPADYEEAEEEAEADTEPETEAQPAIEAESDFNQDDEDEEFDLDSIRKLLAELDGENADEDYEDEVPTDEMPQYADEVSEEPESAAVPEEYTEEYEAAAEIEPEPADKARADIAVKEEVRIISSSAPAEYEEQEPDFSAFDIPRPARTYEYRMERDYAPAEQEDIPDLNSVIAEVENEPESEAREHSAGALAAMENEARKLRSEVFDFDAEFWADNELNDEKPKEYVLDLGGDDEDDSFDARFDMRRPVVGATYGVDDGPLPEENLVSRHDEVYEEPVDKKKAAIGKLLGFLGSKTKKYTGSAAAGTAVAAAETSAAVSAAEELISEDDDEDMLIYGSFDSIKVPGAAAAKKPAYAPLTEEEYDEEPVSESEYYDEPEEYVSESSLAQPEEEPTVVMASGYSSEELRAEFAASIGKQNKPNYASADYGKSYDDGGYDYDDPDGDDYNDTLDDDFPSFREFVVADFIGLLYRITGKQSRSAAAGTAAEDDEELGEEASAEEAMYHYGRFTRSLRLRNIICFVMMLPMLYLSLRFPVTGTLKSLPVTAAALLAIQLTVMLLALDVVTNGILNAARGKVGADSLAVIACIATGFDALLTAKGITPAHVPLCALSSLSIAGALFSSYLSARALRKTMRVPAIGQKAYILTAEHDLLGKDDVTLLKSDAPVEGFVRRAEEAAPDEWLYLLYAPYLLIAVVLISLVICIVTKSFSSFIYVFSATLAPTVPFTALLNFAMPFFIGSAQIFNSGAAVAGWSGINGIGRSKDIVVTDRDLFPDKCVKIAQVRMYDSVDEKKFISYAGTMIVASGSCVAGSFQAFMNEHGIARRPVEGYEYHPGGGFKGVIDGNIVLCGNADMMRLMNIAVRSSHVKPNTIVVAINGVLCGFIDVEYSPDSTVRDALIKLIASSRHPVFAIRDFNVTPQLIREIYDVPTDGYDFPSYIERFRLSSASPDSMSQPMAVICLEGLKPLINTANAGRAMYIATRVNILITLIAALVGLIMALTQILTAGVVAVQVLTIFSVIMALPVMFVSVYMKL